MVVPHHRADIVAVPQLPQNIIGKHRMHPHILHLLDDQRTHKTSLPSQIIRKLQLPYIMEQPRQRQLIHLRLVEPQLLSQVPHQAGHISPVGQLLRQIIIYYSPHLIPRSSIITPLLSLVKSSKFLPALCAGLPGRALCAGGWRRKIISLNASLLSQEHYSSYRSPRSAPGGPCALGGGDEK